MTEIENLPGFLVIDKDTGTVLGTRLVLVPTPDEDREQEILDSDHEAMCYAEKHGIPLFVEPDYDYLDWVAINAQNGNLL